MSTITNASDIWKKYQDKRQTADRLVAEVDRNWRFYLGDQWHGAETGGREFAVYNFIEPIIKYKTSSVCQNKMTANYMDMEERKETSELFKALNRKFSSDWEKTKMDTVLWKAVKVAGIEGTSYTYWGDPLKPQVLGTTSVVLGDEQNDDLQEQPYIIIRERLQVSDVRRIAEQNGVNETISADSEDAYQVGERELYNDDDKVNCLVYYEKIDGEVYYAKCTENVMYEPLQKIEYTVKGEGKRGLSLYPIVPLIWERKPNSARGQSEVSRLIPNQIQLNTVVAQRGIAVEMFAYPKMAVSSSVRNKEAITNVGAIIEVDTDTSQSVNQLISYLNPTTISNDAKSFTDELMNTTRELSGASDTILGQIDPTRVAASAISALKDSASVNIKEQEATVAQYVEDNAKLKYEMWIVYTDPITVVEEVEEEGEIVTSERQADMEELESLRVDVRIDVSQDSNYSKDMARQALDKLLETNKISIEEWAKLQPEGGAIKKNELIKVLNERPQALPERMPIQEVPDEQM
jgi:hypothetical protein